MAVVIKKTVEYDHTFDSKTKRHMINSVQSVFHCHHYTTLYTQLAIDADETELLKECARESFSKMLAQYFESHPEIKNIEDKLEIGCQYYSMTGLGKMNIRFIGNYSGEVEVPFSHTDSGWIKKWGNYDKPINYITAGFAEALFEIALGLPEKSFTANETQSIVMGDEFSTFKVIRR